jgi:hypothetical protein
MREVVRHVLRDPIQECKSNIEFSSSSFLFLSESSLLLRGMAICCHPQAGRDLVVELPTVPLSALPMAG